MMKIMLSELFGCMFVNLKNMTKLVVQSKRGEHSYYFSRFRPRATYVEALKPKNHSINQRHTC